MNSTLTVSRRGFLTGSAAALATPASLAAQQADRAYRIATIVRPGQGSNVSGPAELPYRHEWHKELKRLGYVEGQNLEIISRTVDLPGVEQLAADLARDPPDVIFAPAQNIVARLKAAAVSIPIVAIPIDPVGSGLAESLSRPGGNITGLSLDAGMETMTKRLALLKEISPGMSKVAILILRPYWEGKYRGVFEEAARPVGISIFGSPFDSNADEAQYRSLFASMVDNQVGGLFVTPVLENLTNRYLIASLAIESRLPSINFYREFVEAGGLMSYGPDLDDIFRRAAGYIDQILRGANPAEMPIQQPTKFDLALNLATAEALGITLPPNLLALADKVFE